MKSVLVRFLCGLPVVSCAAPPAANPPSAASSSAVRASSATSASSAVRASSATSASSAAPLSERRGFEAGEVDEETRARPLGPPQGQARDLPVPEVSSTVSTTGVTLDQLLAFADRHAPRLVVARERLGLGDAAIAAEKPVLADNPRLSVAVGPGLNSDRNHVDFQLGVSQRLEIAGQRGLRLEAAEQTKNHLRAELEEERWLVHTEVHAAFHEALVARERLHAAERVLRFQARLLDIAKKSLRAGNVSTLAVRIAEGELSQAQVARLAARQDYREARLQVGQAAGWSSASPPEPLGALDLPRRPPTSERLELLARQHQPRLRTFVALQRQSVARAKVAGREGWPEPTLGANLTRESYAGGPPETQIFGTLTLPVPLARRNQGQRARAQAELNVTAARSHAFEVELRSRIERHRTAVEAAAEQVRTYGSEILPTFEDNLRLIERAFELGEIDILEVSVARERFLSIETEALDAYARYFQNVALLEAAIGTDLWPEERERHADERHTGEEERP